MGREKSIPQKFIEWVLSNTAWDIFKSLATVVLGFVATRWFAVQPDFKGWLARMSIPTIVAVGAMLLGFGLVAWLALSAMAWGARRLLRHKDVSGIPIRTEEYSQREQAEPFISLKVFNETDMDLTECYARLLELRHFYTAKTVLPILEQVNPNNLYLSWGGESGEYVTIRRNGDHRVLNICKSTGAGLFFLFCGHEEQYLGHGKFLARVEINGSSEGKPFKPIVQRFCFEYGYSAGKDRLKELDAGERRNIVVVFSRAEPLGFADCPDKGEV